MRPVNEAQQILLSDLVDRVEFSVLVVIVAAELSLMFNSFIPLPSLFVGDRAGLKCWFFCYDKVGAQASANLFSMVMTCRANDVDRFEYFSYIFEHLPMATTLEALEALLPWNVKPVLEERRKQREVALRSAAAN